MTRVLKPVAIAIVRYQAVAKILNAEFEVFSLWDGFEILRSTRRVVTMINGGDVGPAVDYIRRKMVLCGYSHEQIVRRLPMILASLLEVVVDTQPAPEY